MLFVKRGGHISFLAAYLAAYRHFSKCFLLSGKNNLIVYAFDEDDGGI
jgi:hypothetical protein